MSDNTRISVSLSFEEFDLESAKKVSGIHAYCLERGLNSDSTLLDAYSAVSPSAYHRVRNAKAVVDELSYPVFNAVYRELTGDTTKNLKNGDFVAVMVEGEVDEFYFCIVREGGLTVAQYILDDLVMIL